MSHSPYAPPSSLQLASAPDVNLSGSFAAGLERVSRLGLDGAMVLLATAGVASLLCRGLQLALHLWGHSTDIGLFAYLAAVGLGAPALLHLMAHDEVGARRPSVAEALRHARARAWPTLGAHLVVGTLTAALIPFGLIIGAVLYLGLSALVVPLVALGSPVREAFHRSRELALPRYTALLGRALLAFVISLALKGAADEPLHLVLGQPLAFGNISTLAPLQGFGLTSLLLQLGGAWIQDMILAASTLPMLGVAMELLVRLQGEELASGAFRMPGLPEQAGPERRSR